MRIAHVLLNDGGYDGTVFSDNTAQQWYGGLPIGTPFDIDIERGLERWEDSSFFPIGVMLHFRPTRGQDPLTVRSRFGQLGAAVDLRSRAQRNIRDSC